MIVIMIIVFLTQGQTIGKKLLRLRMVDMDGNLVPVWKIIVLRSVLLSIIMNIAYLLSPSFGSVMSFVLLIDVLLIFRGDRRCIHDFIAGTQVVNVGEEKA